jgi:hypothetical protein
VDWGYLEVADDVAGAEWNGMEWNAQRLDFAAKVSRFVGKCPNADAKVDVEKAGGISTGK